MDEALDELSVAERFVLGIMQIRKGMGQADSTVKQLVTLTRNSEKTVRRVLRKFIRLGWVIRQERTDRHSGANLPSLHTLSPAAPELLNVHNMRS